MADKSHFTCPDCGAGFRTFKYEWGTCGYCGYGYIQDEDYQAEFQAGDDGARHSFDTTNELSLISLGKIPEDLLYYYPLTQMNDLERRRS